MMKAKNIERGTLPPPVELGPLNSILLLVAMALILSSNPLESIFAIVQLKVLLQSYWRKNLPPVALLLFFIPFLEISTPLIEANVRNITLNEMLHSTGGEAYWLSAIGLYAVHIGFFFFFRKMEHPSLEKMKEFAQMLSLERMILAYVVIGPITGFIGGIISQVGSLFQFVTYLNQISLVILIAICMRQSILREVNRTFLIFIAIVTALSFYSFFSEWKTVAYAVFISFGISGALNRRMVIRILFLSVLLGNVLLLWQAIKPMYRAHLLGQENLLGGLQGQGVRIGRTAALGKFLELSQDYFIGDKEEGKQLKNANENALIFSTLRRVGYLEFFALTLNMVPEKMPHEKGALLGKNLSFALIPRFLNPNKGVKNDGAKVTKYTGFLVSDNSSFSLGHYCEHFVDFGYGMWLVLLGLGMAGGIVMNSIKKLSRSFIRNPLYLSGITYIVLEPWGSFQNDSIYLYGLTFFGFITHVLLFRPLYRISIGIATKTITP
jgi:hypothetical protein